MAGRGVSLVGTDFPFGTRGEVAGTGSGVSAERPEPEPSAAETAGCPPRCTYHNDSTQEAESGGGGSQQV